MEGRDVVTIAIHFDLTALSRRVADRVANTVFGYNREDVDEQTFNMVYDRVMEKAKEIIARRINDVISDNILSRIVSDMVLKDVQGDLTRYAVRVWLEVERARRKQ